MSEKTLAKQTQAALQKIENDVLRAATLYCAQHEMEFSGKHRILARVMLRKFYTDGIYPLIKDLNDTNVKKYYE